MSNLKILTSVQHDQGNVHVEVTPNNLGASGARITLHDDKKVLATREIKLLKESKTFSSDISADNLTFWTPHHPKLYGLTIEFLDKKIKL